MDLTTTFELAAAMTGGILFGIAIGAELLPMLRRVDRSLLGGDAE